jgi:uncharacterized protein
MTFKDNQKKPVKKPHQKKIGLSRIIIIVSALILALAFLIFSTYKPIRKKTATNQNSSISRSTSSSSFRMDGSLSIYLSQGSSPLKLEIEISDDEPERMRGLMDRFSLPENAGMLFIFQDEEPRSFWMKNTYISLDIIYINSNKEIVSIQKYTQVQTTTSIPSEKPAMYVLEVNAGLSDRLGINPGDKIDFTRF